MKGEEIEAHEERYLFEKLPSHVNFIIWMFCFRFILYQLHNNHSANSKLTRSGEESEGSSPHRQTKPPREGQELDVHKEENGPEI